MPDISDGMLDLMAYKFKKYLGSVSREIQNRRLKMDDAYVVKKNENLFAKDEVIQMLTDIQLRIEEMAHYESADGQDLVMLADIGELFQEKINALGNIQLKIEEMPKKYPYYLCADTYVKDKDIRDLIQQKINALGGDADDM